MNITERFLKYVGYGTNSDEKSEACPSTPNQLVLGAAIAEELKALGLTDVEQDADGYVYGYLPGEGEALGLIAHMDTSPAVSGDHIKPRIVTYPGGVLELGASTLSPTDYPFLEEYLGQELIVTDGTTLLGADDKAGIAEIMAAVELLEGRPHGEVRVVFTTDEETGLVGAETLDKSQISARTMINLDSEEEGVATVSCAGGASANVSIGLTSAPCALACARLTVSGLIGGHSGQEIDKGRANANLLLGRVLNAVQCTLSFRLVSAAGGLKDNAIPNAAEAVLALREEDMPAAREIAAACEADFRKEYAAADPSVAVALEPAPACDQALTEEATLRVVRFLLLVPNGIAAMSMDIPGLVQTSCNLGIFHVTDSVLTAVSSVRSSVSSQKQMLLARIDALSQLLGGSLHVTGAYPAWEYRRESPLRDKLAAVYTQQTGKTPKIEAIHAGLECGLFAGQLPGLDCVSFGPDLADIHTTREKMSISSVQRTWRFLLGALEALKD